MRKLEKQLTFDTKLLCVESVNSNLAKVKIRVMYTGKNRNKSYFEKDVVVNKMLPTIYNTPIVGYMQDSDFTDHGDQLIIHGNGDVEFKTITYAFGMIPESTEITWENYIEDDGITEHEYLCVTGYVWKRFEDECKKVLQDGSKHSMEINVKSGSWNEKLDAYKVDDAEFAGFCAIGVEPCFEGSKIGGVNSFNLKDLALDFSLLKEEINKLSNIDFNNKEKEVQNLDEKLELVSKYNLTVEELDFSIDDFELEELENKLKEFSENKNSDIEPNNEPEKLNFSATYSQKYDALREAVSTKNDVKKDEDGNLIEEYWYWVQDFDDEYVYTEQSHWTKDSYDNTIIRFSYTFNQTDLKATIGDDPVEMIMTLLTKEEHDKIQADRLSAEAQFSELQTKYNSLVEENNKLVEFKNEQEKAEKEIIFEAFSDRLTSDEMQPIVDKLNDLSKDEIELQLFALVGKKADDSKLNFNKNQKHKVGLFDNIDTNMSAGLKAVINRKK